jgi:glutaredoxin
MDTFAWPFRFGSARKKDDLMDKVIFYHAGCPVCLEAETKVAAALDRSRYTLETVHLGQAKARVSEARQLGVKSVPALVLDGQPFHINFGADLKDLG